MFAVLVLSLQLWACGGGDDPEGPVDPAVSEGRVVRLDHGAFVLDYDCDARASVRFEYTLTTDVGRAARAEEFELHDPLLPAGCAAQSSAASYAGVMPGWDRGHLVAANHMDQSDATMAATFLMSNIVPQRAALNRGLWEETEALAECLRDIAPVQVAGGVVFDDAGNDAFVASHGIRTPDAFWKALVTADLVTGGTRVIAWWIPSIDPPGGWGSLDRWLVSVAELESRLGASRVGLPALSPELKSRRAATTWSTPANCDPG